MTEIILIIVFCFIVLDATSTMWNLAVTETEKGNSHTEGLITASIIVTIFALIGVGAVLKFVVEGS